MNDFVYENPVRVVFAPGALSRLGEEAAKLSRRALLVSYAKKTTLTEVKVRARRSLETAGVECVECFNVTANPLLSQAEEGAALCRARNIGVIVGLGGGSVMDCAKVIAAGVLYPHPLRRMIMFSHSEATRIPPETALPTVMVPTVAATGSEMNPTAVITDDRPSDRSLWRKSYIWEPACLFPRVALLDPALTASLPPYQTACGAVDIIAHAAEAYFNGEPGRSLELHDRLQEGLILAVRDILPRVMATPDDTEARGVLLWASSIALNGWLTSGTFGFTPLHQLGHVLSARYNAVHGATLAAMITAYLRYSVNLSGAGRCEQFARRIFGCGAAEAADRFEQYCRGYGVQTRITDFGASEGDIDSLTSAVAEVSFSADGMLNGNPRLTRRDVSEIFKLSL